MRKYINLTNLLFEASQDVTMDELAAMKIVIADKIKELPNDNATVNTLREIEDLLSHLHIGGSKSGIINDKLNQINDPTVIAAQKMLSRDIMSLSMTPAQRDELFTLWREDKLIDRKKLITPGNRTIADVVENYNTNPVIKELVDDLMHIQALGQGKGEFALTVLSKHISKPEKGDLLVDGIKVEVKTTDGGSGRYTDQEVRPAEGFEKAARELNQYVINHPENPLPLPKSGLNLSTAVQFAQQISDKDAFVKMCENVISIIFGGAKADHSAIKAIGDAISAGNTGAALQEYAKASYNYYMSIKEDEGVLYINLTKDPINFIYFKDANDLTSSGLRLHAGTVYITSINDVRLPYPQMEVIPTTFGANAAASAEKLTAKVEKKAERQAKIDQK